MSASPLPPNILTELHNVIDDAASDRRSGLPCASVVLVGGEKGSVTELFFHSTEEKKTGEAGDGSEIYWLASCTKLVTGIACMQLVEKGILDLDNGDQVETLCPELRDMKVLKDDGTLEEKKQKITLRMLLTHTAGFGYSFLNKKLEGYKEFSGEMKDFLQPLVNQPGEMFEYGINLDWAGILVERASGLRLNDYMQRHIFEPLQVRDMSMIPSEQMRQRLQGIWQRTENGELNAREYPGNRPLVGDQPSTDTFFHSGGGGLFGSIREYGKILMALLNDGISQITGHRILSPETVNEMFTNQIAHMPNFARRALPAINPDLVYPVSELYPLAPPTAPQGWGLTFMLSPGVTGRSGSTAHWSGLSNVFWWCDREKGIAGVVGSQVLPFVDPSVAKLWVDVETFAYKGVQNM